MQSIAIRDIARAHLELRRRRQRKLNNIPTPEKNEQIEKARKDFTEFVRYTKPDYQWNWHHTYLSNKLQKFATGEIKRLMVFMPPQHGKSELVSRRLPAYLLGIDPSLKIVAASYSDTLASSFNRDVQRIIDDYLYNDLFPETILPKSSVSNIKPKSGNYLRNTDIFETIDYNGYYNSVGVGGSLTGKTADIAIIDDPIKDVAEAYSPVYRNRIWDWYINVLETRLHNDSKVLITLTRWHEDDLVGRIIAGGNVDNYEIVSFPGLKEDNKNPDDPREIGEALWPERHSQDKLEKVKDKSKRTFVSLYQQRPAPEEGDIIKKYWFKEFYPSDLPSDVIKDFYSDTAYGKESSDNSATMVYSIHEDNLYIWEMGVVNYSLPDFKKWYVEFIKANGYNGYSECVFEPKATGISTVQELRTMQLDGRHINVMEGAAPKDGKVARMVAASPVVESGRVYLLKGGAWVESFLLELTTFPNGAKDDQSDCLSAVINRRLQFDIYDSFIT